MNKKQVIVIWIMINLIFVLATIHIITSDQKQLYGLGTSMQPSNIRQLEVFDSGDGIMYEPLEGNSTLHTYYNPINSDDLAAGDHGDVVVFKVNNMRYVHRLVCFVILNQTMPKVTVDIPELNIYNRSEVDFISYGFDKMDFTVDFTKIFDPVSNNGNINAQGYLTKGDSLLNVDQHILGIQLVDNSSIVGKVISIGDNDLFPNNFIEFTIYIGAFVSILAIYNLRYRGVDIGEMNYHPLFISIWASIIIIKIGLTTSASSLCACKLVASLLFLIGLAIVIYILFRKINNNDISNDDDNSNSNHMDASRIMGIVGLFPLLIIPYSISIIMPIEFIYSANAIILLAIILSLDPRYFIDIRKPDIETKWMLLLSFTSMIFLISIILPFPVYLTFLIGVVAGNIYCYTEVVP